ncbi:MAG TPA: DUF3943 domain-containing protein [Cytophagaceae bacterium]
MKICYTIILFIISLNSVEAQIAGDTIKPGKGNREDQLEAIKKRKEARFKDTLGAEPVKAARLDTTIYNKYGDLLRDDTAYNKRQPIWKPALQVLAINSLFMGYNRYIAKADYGYVDLHTWRTNLKSTPEWDTDEFGINFLGHPYQGTLYFNAARSNGFNYWQSLPFAFGGSLTWEYFGENTLPSFNDMIYTPINGAALGEILYRISSNILDDRTRGANRAIREVAAGIINPVRGVNRLIQGKTFRTTNKEVYQKEPLNVTLFAGIHRLNEESGDVFGRGRNKVMLNMQFDYGNPFENRRRKPFDLFRLRTEFSTGGNDTIAGTVNNITGYGILFGKNKKIGSMSVLTGIFQYYDYWNTRNFVLGALSFGGGAISKLPLSKQINLYTNVHLGIIPLAGNSNRTAPDSSGLRDYVYAYGTQAKIESTLSLSKYASIALVYYHFWIKTFEGLEGKNSIGVFRPRLTVRVFKNVSIGYEHFGYSTNRTLKEYAAQKTGITEQKIFIQFFLEDSQRRGRYN